MAEMVPTADDGPPLRFWRVIPSDEYGKLGTKLLRGTQSHFESYDRSIPRPHSGQTPEVLAVRS
jgi:hypothetical protein